MSAVICKFNQTEFGKFGGFGHKYHENEICIILQCERITCRKQHPNNCKYFLEKTPANSKNIVSSYIESLNTLRRSQKKKILKF